MSPALIIGVIAAYLLATRGTGIPPAEGGPARGPLPAGLQPDFFTPLYGDEDLSGIREGTPAPGTLAGRPTISGPIADVINTVLGTIFGAVARTVAGVFTAPTGPAAPYLTRILFADRARPEAAPREPAEPAIPDGSPLEHSRGTYEFVGGSGVVEVETVTGRQYLTIPEIELGKEDADGGGGTGGVRAT